MRVVLNLQGRLISAGPGKMTNAREPKKAAPINDQTVEASMARDAPYS